MTSPEVSGFKRIQWQPPAKAFLDYNLRHGKSSFRIEEQCCAMYFSSFLKEQGCGPGRYFFPQFEKKIILPRILVQPSMAQPCSFAVAATHARGSHVRSPREHSSRRRAGGRFFMTESVTEKTESPDLIGFMTSGTSGACTTDHVSCWCAARLSRVDRWSWSPARLNRAERSGAPERMA